jgi:hypothetical protein
MSEEHPGHKIEIRDGMRIEWDAPITMEDGIVLRADVMCPVADGKYPVILTYGPYAKGLAFQEGYKTAWTRMITAFPEVAEGTSNKYQSWELVDPEKWVPEGYVCLRVDSRGAGQSPGFLDVWSPRETQDLYQCIEWAGTQPWSNGKVGLNGISYYAMNQWQVAALNPPHLAAFCAWEGASDYYRELCRHGGILSEFLGTWYNRQVKSVQYGVGERGARSQVTGAPVAGFETLSDEELAKNRADVGGEALNRELIDEYYQARIPRLEDIKAPLLSAGNWGGVGLHPRGNFEGFVRAGSNDKWLEVHGDTHFSHFYSNYGMAVQKRFFGHFLKGEDNGWDREPRVQLNVRHPGEKFVLRGESEWPLARTNWTKFYLDPSNGSLGTAQPRGDASLTYETTGDGLMFMSAPLKEEMEFTGPIAARLFLSSETTDADVFLALRVYDRQGTEVSFIGSNDPRTPVALGWLRASHRKLDPKRSLPYRPWHTHDELQPLKPGVPVELEVEVWPTSIVIPAGYRFALNVRGRDYEYDGDFVTLPFSPAKFYGVGPFTHTNPVDRPPEIFGRRNTLHFAAGKQPYVLLPHIPAKSRAGDAAG